MIRIIKQWCIFKLYPSVDICIWIKTKNKYHQYIIWLEYGFKHNVDTKETLPRIVNIGL